MKSFHLLVAQNLFAEGVWSEESQIKDSFVLLILEVLMVSLQ